MVSLNTNMVSFSLCMTTLLYLILERAAERQKCAYICQQNRLCLPACASIQFDQNIYLSATRKVNDQAVIRNQYNQIPHPIPKTKRGRSKHTKIDNYSRKTLTVNRINNSFPNRSLSATLIENSSNIYFYLKIFYLKFQNRTKQGA